MQSLCFPKLQGCQHIFFFKSRITQTKSWGIIDFETIFFAAVLKHLDYWRFSLNILLIYYTYTHTHSLFIFIYIHIITIHLSYSLVQCFSNLNMPKNSLGILLNVDPDSGGVCGRVANELSGGADAARMTTVRVARYLIAIYMMVVLVSRCARASFDWLVGVNC